MSYSIGKKAPTGDELQIAIRDELSKVPETQPIHESDIDQAFDAARSLIALMKDDPARDLYCSVSGSIWKTDAGVQSLSLNISVNFQERKE